MKASANQLSKLTQKRLGSPMTSTEPKLAKLTAEPVCKENPLSSLPRTVGQADELSDTATKATNPALSPFPGMVGQANELSNTTAKATNPALFPFPGMVGQADELSDTTAEATNPALSPFLGMVGQADKLSDTTAEATNPALSPFPGMVGQVDKLCSQEFGAVIDQANKHRANKADHILPLDLDTLAETNELRGCEGVISLLESRLADLLEPHPGQGANVSDTNTETYPGTVGQADTINECELHDAEERDRQCVVAALLEKVRAICPQDPHVRYICRKLSFWVDKQASQPLTDSTERTVDVFEVLHFTKLPSGIKLRYGDGSSSADRSDKLLRNSNTRVGKKVDYLLKTSLFEFGAGENSGGGQGLKVADTAHVSENFVDNIKIPIWILRLERVTMISVALRAELDHTSNTQIRHATTHVTQPLEDNGLKATAEIMDLFSEIAIPLFQIWNGQIRFSLSFGLSQQLFAFTDFDEAQMPVTKTDTPDFLSICKAFLLVDALIIQSNKKLIEMQNLNLAAVCQGTRIFASDRFGSLGARGAADCFFQPLPAAIVDWGWHPSSSPRARQKKPGSGNPRASDLSMDWPAKPAL
ncbi:hypothetical protein PhCBS80983_g03328 [Powellomyces hirtus]|uniref:Uncharacterized protein n=1 Tax=Powellomyces hirtus TaxID=109895 RepID=A0A507E461_9FUNG|nr:hypothetical protein PhCBS80983_g03328 [Powellomyces hirtus]